MESKECEDSAMTPEFLALEIVSLEGPLTELGKVGRERG